MAAGTAAEAEQAGGGPLDFWQALSPVNQILLAVAAAALVGGIVFLASGTATTSRQDLAPLFRSGQLTQGERAAALAAFQEANLDGYQYDGDTFFVPLRRRNDYLAALAANDALPRNFGSALQEYYQRTNWFDPPSQRETNLRLFTQAKLEDVISAFPEVGKASVTVTPPPQRGLRQTGMAEASVVVFTDVGRPISPQRQRQIQAIVAASFPDLPQANVEVTSDLIAGVGSIMGGACGKGNTCVDTTAFKLDNPHILSKEAYKECIERDIRRLFPGIDGVVVVANVEVSEKRDIERNETFYDKGAVREQDTTTRSSEEPVGAGGAGAEPGFRTNVDQPGVAPNQGASVAGASQAATESDETTRSVYDNNVVNESHHVGDHLPTKVGVVINIPNEHSPTASPVLGEDGQPLANQPEPIDPEQVRQAILGLGYAGVVAEGVTVRFYEQPEEPEVSAAGFSLANVGQEYGWVGYALIGLAAVIVAFVVARRALVPASIRDALAEAATRADDEEAESQDDVVVDEDRARYELMKQQITQMVGGSPDVAASLVRRWLSVEE